MQSTGHSSMHARSSTSTQGSAMMYVTYELLCQTRPGRRSGGTPLSIADEGGSAKLTPLHRGAGNPQASQVISQTRPPGEPRSGERTVAWRSSPCGRGRQSTGSPGTFFFFNDTATTEIYTLSLHDALPI